jgi:hypothetical protein
MIGMTMGFLRFLNREDPTAQGDVNANSAKALNELKSGITAFVRDILWRPHMTVGPQMLKKAMQMDVRLWGDVRKTIRGVSPIKGESDVGKVRRFQFSYVPNKDIAGYEEMVEIEPGSTLGGTAGRLEMMQLVGSELMSEETAIEQGDWARDMSEEMRRIEAQRIKKLMWANLEALAAGSPMGQLNPAAIPRILKGIQEDGKEFAEMIEILQETGELMLEPPAPEGAPPGMGPEGMPPEMAALMGGEPPALPPGGGEELPPLEMLRG